MRLSPLLMLSIETDGSGIVLDPQTDHVMTLNKVGVFIWRLLEKNASDDAILTEMTEVFSVDRAIAENDLRSFLASLAERGLLFAGK